VECVSIAGGDHGKGIIMLMQEISSAEPVLH
jgi:hypothetical protein